MYSLKKKDTTTTFCLSPNTQILKVHYKKQSNTTTTIKKHKKKKKCSLYRQLTKQEDSCLYKHREIVQSIQNKTLFAQPRKKTNPEHTKCVIKKHKWLYYIFFLTHQQWCSFR